MSYRLKVSWEGDWMKGLKKGMRLKEERTSRYTRVCVDGKVASGISGRIRRAWVEARAAGTTKRTRLQ